MNTSELLSNHDLNYFCNKLKINLIDIDFKDKIQITKPGSYIINLDHSSLLDGFNGTHWVCLYISSTEIIYFDSFGFKMPPIILKKIKQVFKNHKIFQNTNQYQHINSVYCGWYVLLLLYICKKNYKVNARNIMSRYRQIFYYDKNRVLNDNILKNIIKIIFDY